MVLKQGTYIKCKGPNQITVLSRIAPKKSLILKGYTLAELLITLAVAGIVMGLAANLLNRFEIQTILFFNQKPNVSSQILSPWRKVLRQEAFLEQINKQGIKIKFTNGTLRQLNRDSIDSALKNWNKNAVLELVEFKVFGPEAAGSFLRQFSDPYYAAKDDNKDGLIDMSELDEDLNGTLEYDELFSIGLIGIKITYSLNNALGTEELWVHTRNRTVKENPLPW